MGDVFDQALGQALRKLRTERGWSQSDLALHAQMDRNYLSLIELGRSSPSVRMLLRLCAGRRFAHQCRAPRPGAAGGA